MEKKDSGHQEISDLVTGLMQKLDEERRKNSRLESELSQYREGKSVEKQLAEKDAVIEKQKTLIDSLNAKLAWLQRKVWGQSSEKHSSTFDEKQLNINFGDLDISPEEEAAYKKAQEELNAYHTQRKAVAEKCKESNKPSRNPIPENIRRERVYIYLEGYNE